MSPEGDGIGESTLSPPGARELLEQARTARAQAYAPYSGFPVGAALLARDGRVFRGVNVENASYGLTTCAERTAVVAAVAAGARDFVAVAITGPEDRIPCPPCGACRQILQEVSPGLVVVTSGEDGEPSVTTLADLLPGPFDAASIRRRRPRS